MSTLDQAVPVQQDEQNVEQTSKVNAQEPAKKNDETSQNLNEEAVYETNNENQKQTKTKMKHQERVYTAPKGRKKGKRMSNAEKNRERNRHQEKNVNKTAQGFYSPDGVNQHKSPFKSKSKRKYEESRPYTTKAQLRRILNQEKEKYIGIGFNQNKTYQVQMLPQIRQSKTQNAKSRSSLEPAYPYLKNIKNRMIQKMGKTGGPMELDIENHQAKQLFHDKERMYEERLHLKASLNRLTSSNLQLRTKLKNVTKEASKFENLFVQNSIPKKRKRKRRQLENCLTVELRKQVKDLKSKLDKSNNLVGGLKRKIKYTKLEELESEKEAFETEAKRLRDLLTQTVKLKVEEHITPISRKSNRSQIKIAKEQAQQIFVQSSLINTLNNDNQEMASHIRVLQEKLRLSNVSIESLELQMSKQRKSINKLKIKNRKLQNKLQEIGDEWDEDKNGGETKTMKKKTKIKDQLDKLERYNKQQLMDNENNQRLIKKLNFELQEEKDRTEKRLKLSSLQFQADLDEITQKYQKQIAELQERLNDQQSYTFQDTDNKGNNKNKKSNHSPQKSTNQTVQFQSQQKKSRNPQKLQKVSKEDIKGVTEFLRLKLMSNYTSTEMLHKILKDTAIDSKLTIKQLQTILQSPPFYLEGDDDRSFLISRYLIEDNTIDVIKYDENLSLDVFMINSILKTALSNYKLYTMEQEEDMHNQLVFFFNRYGQNLKDLFKTNPLIKKTGQINPKLLDQILKELNVKEYKNIYCDYIITKIMQNSKRFTDMKYQLMFSHFSKPFEEIKQQILQQRQNNQVQNDQTKAENNLQNDQGDQSKTNQQEVNDQTAKEQLEIQEVDIDEQEEAALE